MGEKNVCFSLVEGNGCCEKQAPEKQSTHLATSHDIMYRYTYTQSPSISGQAGFTKIPFTCGYPDPVGQCFRKSCMFFGSTGVP